MSSQKTAFLQALQLPPDLTDEACSRSLSELISLAAKEQPHSVSLRHIYEAVLQHDSAAYLEPLDVLPTLLPCRHDGSMDLIRICAPNGSSKEVILVIQAAIEHVQLRLNSEQEEQEQESGSDLVQRTMGIVSLCAPAISRAQVGKRSALQWCSPMLDNVASLIGSVSPFSTKEQGRALITGVAQLVQCLAAWATTVAVANELQKIKTILHELLDTTVVSYTPSIQASLAVRAAESFFPRFFVKSSEKADWKGGEEAMHQVQLALESLGKVPSATYTSFSDLVYLAHATPPVNISPSALPDLFQTLVDALQMNMAIDESLFLLLRILTSEDKQIPLDVATSLCTVFSALASTHLDPTIRQLNLRLLSVTLTKLPPPPRVDVLLKLTTDEDFPQIRGPAVGLVKEAVLEALALPPERAARNPFASPELLRMFGGVLFRPNPPEFFSEHKTREELAQSLELLRLADCLAFYYVLLQRDCENKTGVRSKDNRASVQHSLLDPLRHFVDDHLRSQELPLMAILALLVGLDRIDGAIHLLDTESDRGEGCTRKAQ